MAKNRIIPKLLFNTASSDVNSAVLVTTVQYDRIIEMGDPISQAKIYDAQMADELIFIDISIYKNRMTREKSLEILDKAARNIFLPLTIGGGVCSLDDINTYLQHGADKVCVNTFAINNFEFISSAANRFGSSTIVVGIDYRIEANGDKIVYSHGGKINTSRELFSWVKQVAQLGAGEILLSCINHDGTRQGLDTAGIAALVSSVDIPVILSGGCGLAQHFSDGFIETGCSAVAAGTFFCFQDQNIMQTRSQVFNAGIPVRLRT